MFDEYFMSRWIKLQALAQRAVTQWSLTGRQAAAAKRSRKEFYESVWRSAAKELDAEVTVLDDDLLHIQRDQQFARLCQNYTELDGPVSLKLAGRKPLVARMLTVQGVPVPSGMEFPFADWRKAEAFLARHACCVVKPASGTGGGQGVTTGIETMAQLRRAVVAAAGFGSNMLIERQYAGRNLRLLFLDNQLLDVVERRPPSVRGDGKSTIRQLIAAENQRRVRFGHTLAQSVLHVDHDLRQTLAKQRRSLRWIPAADETVPLKTAINDNSANENCSFRDVLHPELVATARRAASLIGLRLAGVDVLTPDPSRPLETVDGVILEINSTPGLHCHYAQRGPARNVAVPILDACLNASESPQSLRLVSSGALCE